MVRFKYAFDVDGKTYNGVFSRPNAVADQIEIGGTIPVAYANFDPSQSQREKLLAMNANMKSNLMSAVSMSAPGAFLIGLFWLTISYFLVWPRVRTMD